MSNMSTYVKKSPFPRKEKGGIVRSGIITLLILGGLFAGVYYGWGYFFSGVYKQAGVIQVPVIRGTFIHEVNGKGNAESAKNVDISSKVEGSATIIWIIPEGEVVKEDDDLVLLDSSNIEDKLNSQQITFNSSLARVASSQATLRTTELSLEEYIEGTFEQNWTNIENNIYTAKETQKQKADSVRFTERLVSLGYTTTAQLDVNKVAEQSAINTVKSSVLEQKVLLNYSSEKKITELMSSIETARADVNSHTYTNRLDKNRLDYYRKQFENCTIKAPQEGQVVYANQDNRRMSSESDMIKEGATVRERQVLIRLPDPNQMQVKAMINEASISAIRNGMKTMITFDAITNKSFEGTVIKVNQYPEVVWMSSAKDYVTVIKIDDSNLDIRAGLTAEVRIIAKKFDNVLTLPLQSVVEVGRKTYCIKCIDGNWSYKEVLLGDSNDKQVIILKGLEEGETVIAGARQYKEKVEFPEASASSIYPEKQLKLDAEKVQEESLHGSTPASDPTTGSPATPESIPVSVPAGPSGTQQGGPGMSVGGGGEGRQRPAGGEGGPGGFGGEGRQRPAGGEGGPSGFGGEGRQRPAGGEGGEGRQRPAGGEGGPGGFGGEGRQRRPQGEGTPAGGMPSTPGMAGGDPSTSDHSQQPGSASPAGVTPPKRTTSNLASSASTERVQLQEEEEKREITEKLNRIKPIVKYFTMTAMELCRKLDANRDKMIDQEEITATAPELLEFYKDWDRNSDGKWSQTDFVIGFCSSRNLYLKSVQVFLLDDKDKNEKNESPSSLQDLLASEPQEIFTKLDANKDGFLEESELPKEPDMLKRFFTRLDEDQDGKVSAEDFVRGLTLIKNQMRSGAPGGGGGGRR